MKGTLSKHLKINPKFLHDHSEIAGVPSYEPRQCPWSQSRLAVVRDSVATAKSQKGGDPLQSLMSAAQYPQYPRRENWQWLQLGHQRMHQIRMFISFCIWILAINQRKVESFSNQVVHSGPEWFWACS